MSYNSKYTGAEVEALLGKADTALQEHQDISGKQDVISDLAAIREGAAKGATALQSIPAEYVTETELTNKGYATTSAMNTALGNKVDKVTGKQLTTEDFTTALKTKLEGLNNYDDSAIQEAVEGLQTQLNTLVSGDADTAIESFNEIIAFLEGVADTETLEGIIAGIEQQIASKQDAIDDLATIRSGAALGATSVQPSSLAAVATSGSYADLSNKPTIPDALADLSADASHRTVTDTEKATWNAKSDFSGSYNDLSDKPTIPSAVTVDSALSSTSTNPVQNKVINSALSGKQATISDLATIRSGASAGATAVQPDDLATVATSGSYNDLSNKPTIPSAVTESTVSGWGFTKNTGTYSKPSTGIPKSDLASAVQTSLGKADTALQSYTEQYKGTITGVSANGTSVATSGVANIPAASTSAYGVTKLSSSTSSTSTTLAATSSAVKAAYDLANSKGNGTITGITMNGVSKGTSGVVNLGTVITEHQDISGKQDKLVSGTNIKTINGSSLLGSGNLVISGGGGGGSSAYSEVSHGTSDTTFTLTSNTFHVWDEVASLTLTLGDETAGVANEFLFQFNSGETATTLTLPDTLKWANDSAPTIEANKTYQISILKGLASVLVFDNTPKIATISFKIRNFECIAEEGMTWEQWVSSEYNTISCTLMGNYIRLYGEMVGTSNTVYVNKIDIIISDFAYTLIPMT